jgi:hypothetical protein
MRYSKLIQLPQQILWIVLCGVGCMGLVQCGDQKKKSPNTQGQPVSDVPAEWSGAEDWSGSPWTLEDE